MEYLIRPLALEDEPFLWQMLYEAAHMTQEDKPVDAVKNHPDLAKYVRDWGRTTDIGFVAIFVNKNQSIGAVWLRLLTGENKGYGYINDATPELAIAVLPEHTGKGVGTQLIAHVLEAAKALYPSVSLSVRATNPAKRLYERLGFRVVEGSETVNRIGGTSVKMKVDF
jgi:ribosomal protein S18 acetylase RimI-like enzyme